MLKKFVRMFGGDPNKREIDKYSGIVEEINALESQYEALSDEDLAAKTVEFRSRLGETVDGLDEEDRKRAERETLDEILPEAFAAVREASKRTIGLRHYDVQLIGGIALHQGKIAEMRTGEGKTLVATLPLYLNALTGRGVHLVTVNDYLARRDARWMAPIFNALGISVGVLQMAARTENGKKAFIVDLNKESPHEDQHQLVMVPRQEAYAADIIYGTNSEFGFDYLRDNMTMRMDERVQRGHYYAIVDEVDNVLIDEARTPLIISGPAQDEAEWYIRVAQVVRQLRPEDYEISEKDRTITLTEIGETHVEELLGMTLRDPDRPEDVTPEQERMMGYLEQALRAQFLFRRNKDYLVQAGKVVIIDEFTGRLMPGRRWSDGLHQAVEAKEGVHVESENVTYATITIQNYFRMYDKLAGMTGTAVTEAEEFDKIYKLDVLAIPTNLEFQASRTESELEEKESRDEQGYKFQYYANRKDPEKLPVFWRRKDFPDIVYRTEEAKLRSIVQEILRYHVQGRPLLVGTTSVELSERVSLRLRAEPLRRLSQVLLLRTAWFKKYNREEDGRQVEELQFLNVPLEQLDIASLRKMARDLEMSFNPEDPSNLAQLLELLNLVPDDQGRLLEVLKAGIPHEVLNARKHTEESQIIAGAGAFGAVTIATNMAGRGVDIKLGGELAEEILAAASRVLKRAGYEDPYDMTLEERQQALLKMDSAEFGIYETEIRFFLQHMEDMQKVRELGGLHVIGSERHEARRIDNQLRGRAARQGDPGSSRFYLSMEDELMRLFGGQQADNLMQRLRIDDAMPLEMGLVGRIVEQSQTRVEGSNFDVRKHLLEYDDVLNTQRSKIYAQRNLIFTKEDLSEDVSEMLRTEVSRRIPEALQDEEGPWKMLAWLDQIQPPLQIEGQVFPTYTQKLLLDYLETQLGAGSGQPVTVNKQDIRNLLLRVAENSLRSEQNHLLRTVDSLLDQTQTRLESQQAERREAIDTFFEGLSLGEEEGEARSQREIADELSNVTRIPLRLTSEQLRVLKSEDRGALDQLAEEVSSQVESSLVIQAITRLIGSIERRLEESLELNPSQLPADDWYALANQILARIQNVFDKRVERYIQGNGQIAVELDNALARMEGQQLGQQHLLYLLMLMPQGAKASFDKKTHRRVYQRTTRLSYVFYAAQLMDNREEQEVVEEITEHLELAKTNMQRAWGISEWRRLAASTVVDLDETTRKGLREVLGEQIFQQFSGQALQNLPAEDRERVVDELGRQTLTEIYRQLLLGVITELWVDYLTQMEALRISIGLEAYAQRDPLVQYKSRAFGLFQDLLNNMRSGVVARMFTYQPRDLGSVQTTISRADSDRNELEQPEDRTEAGQPEDSEAEERVPAVSQAPAQQPTKADRSTDGKKRRRRRH